MAFAGTTAYVGRLCVQGGDMQTKFGRKWVFLAGVAAATASLGGAAMATAPSGILSGAVLARAVFRDAVSIKFKVDEGSQEVVHVGDARETVIQRIEIAPGGTTGWHSHPGPAVALIKAGALTLYSGDDPTCAPRTYSDGQAFVDAGQGHVHMARNLSQTQNVEIWVTYFDVPPGGAFRLDAANPGNCSF
jgi:quercetin dioxygenase-like cupin family protein